MTSSSSDEKQLGNASLAASLTDEDRALLQALVVWRRTGDDLVESAGADEFVSRVWQRLEPARAARLREVWSQGSAAPGLDKETLVLDRLRRSHQATARVDLDRVHPSWWIRALQEESPGVQRVVAASAPAYVRQAISDGLLLDAQDMSEERPINPEVRSWILALWTERLVGGEPVRPDDPPVIRVFSGLSPRDGYRLCQMSGIAKGVLAGQVPATHAPKPRDRTRWDWLETRLANVDEGFRQRAWKDVQSIAAPKVPRRHHTARIGLFTIARLLVDCEAFRIRWAIQHWPYPIAKLLRSLMTENPVGSTSMSRSESRVLKTAWDRLNLEGRLAMSWPDRDRDSNGGDPN